MLLNLWATWCIPCRAEMPTLDALAGRKGAALPVITLSQDMKGRELVDPYFAQVRVRASPSPGPIRTWPSASA